MHDEPTLAFELNTSQSLAIVTESLSAALANAQAENASVLHIRLTASDAELPRGIGARNIREVSKWEKAITLLQRVETLTLVSATESVGGVAFDLLTAVDFAVLGAGAGITPPTLNGALWPGRGISRLGSRDRKSALSCVISPRELFAEDCVSLGLVDLAVDDVEAEVSNTIERARHTNRGDLRVLRQLIDESAQTSNDSLGLHLAACDRALRRASDEDKAA